MLSYWDIHGVTVRMDSEVGVPPILEYGLRHHRADGLAADIVFHLAYGAPAPKPNEGVRVSFRRPLPVEGVVGDDGFWLRAGEGTLTGDLKAGRIEVAVPDVAWLEEPTVVRTLLPIGLMMPLARRGLFYVHAAILVDPDGTGWLLAGGGDVGKSTTTYRLLERGWSWVCDDGGLLRDEDGRIVALSFWDELQLDHAMADRLGGVEWEERPASHVHKGVVATDRMFGSQRVDRADVSRLVVLSRGEPDGSASAPTRTESLATLVDDNPLMLVNATRANFDVFARLVAQCDVGSVRVGEEALRDPESALRAAIG